MFRGTFKIIVISLIIICMKKNQLTEESIMLAICQILIDEMFVNGPINYESSLVEDFGFDSLEVIDLVIQLEIKFGISFDAETERALRTVGDAVKATKSAIDNSFNEETSFDNRNKILKQIIVKVAEMTNAMKSYQIAFNTRLRLDLELSDEDFEQLARWIKEKFNIDIDIRYLKDIETVEDLAVEIMR